MLKFITLGVQHDHALVSSLVSCRFPLRHQPLQLLKPLHAGSLNSSSLSPLFGLSLAVGFNEEWFSLNKFIELMPIYNTGASPYSGEPLGLTEPASCYDVIARNEHTSWVRLAQTRIHK